MAGTKRVNAGHSLTSDRDNDYMFGISHFTIICFEQYPQHHLYKNCLTQGSHGREKGRELFFLFPTLKRSGRMIFFNKVVKRSGKMKSANGNFPKVQITRKFGIDLLQ